MEPENHTVRLLQEIRDEVRHSSEKSELRFEKMDQRAEVVETTLRDLAQQMVMLARGIKTALEHRSSVDNRLDDAERRLNELEKRVGH
jgi:septal ring factor EnvC (AmiA/AmiB activator)